MHNDFRQKINAGLRQLAATQGENGMASGPPADPKPVEEGQAPTDADAPMQLSKLEQDANVAEADVEHVEQENGLRVVAGWQ